MLDARWPELEARAVSILRDPKTLPKAPTVGNRQFILQLWHHPAFDSWMSWTVYSPWHGQSTTGLVRRAIWDHGLDVQAMTDPVKVAQRRGSAVPTVNSKDAEIAWDVVTGWRNELTRLRVPLVHQGPFGTDGEYNGLRQGDGFITMEFNWWGAGPSEWKDLVQFHNRAREACDALFP